MSIVIGIDPGGSSGGIALITPKGAFAIPMPKTIRDIQELLESIKARTKLPIVAYLEIVHTMPKQGISSAFSFGKNYGHLEAAVMFSNIRLERVSPQKWQGYLRCRTGGDKNVTKRKAQELFPSLKITHAVADALLIAEFGRRMER